ncbi:MAG: SufD family Fe-S cluster assembly protein [Puniceicoccales bacterium]|jgi:hypothetical protein|nr:SufD family Fe-S cluster assembly protein [Puniceicoccales bacterium]
MSIIQRHFEELADGRSDFLKSIRGGKVSIETGARVILHPTGEVSADVTIGVNASLDIVIFAAAAAAIRICLNFSLANFSSLKCLILSENCENLEIKVAASLDGENSNSSVKNFFFGENFSRQIFFASQRHGAKNSTSRVLSQTALDDFATSEFHGNITIGECAENSDAQQRNGNVLLSENATAVSSPDLNILNSNVKCSHGATVGSIDGDAMFYMTSRGIPQRKCKELAIEGMLLSLINS